MPFQEQDQFIYKHTSAICYPQTSAVKFCFTES